MGTKKPRILSAADLPELITDTQSDYESLAIDLANDPLKLKEYKSRLLNNRLTMPPFNTQCTTKNIELAYIQMMERYWNGLLPDKIVF